MPKWIQVNFTKNYGNVCCTETIFSHTLEEQVYVNIFIKNIVCDLERVCNDDISQMSRKKLLKLLKREGLALDGTTHDLGTRYRKFRYLENSESNFCKSNTSNYNYNRKYEEPSLITFHFELSDKDRIRTKTHLVSPNDTEKMTELVAMLNQTVVELNADIRNNS